MTDLYAIPGGADENSAKKRRGAPRGVRPRADAGPLERATVLEINELKLSGREYDRWREIAIMAATTADASQAEGKSSHFNPAIKVLTDAMDRLHGMNRTAKGEPVGGDGDDILGGLGTFGSAGS